MNFYDKYIALCNRAGKSPSAVALEIGLSKPTITRWKRGGGVTDATITKVAKYFGVSVEELNAPIDDCVPAPSSGKQKEPTADDSELTKNKLALIEFAMKVPEEKAAMILQVMRTIVEVEQ